MEDKTIYISGIIGNGGKCTPEEILENVKAGEEIYGDLIDKGYAPFCPHLSYYPDKRWNEEHKRHIDHPKWLQVDKQWVNRCKYFFYMDPIIYGESKGAKMELAWAKAWGKRIFYNLKEVPAKHEITV